MKDKIPLGFLIFNVSVRFFFCSLCYFRYFLCILIVSFYMDVFIDVYYTLLPRLILMIFLQSRLFGRFRSIIPVNLAIKPYWFRPPYSLFLLLQSSQWNDIFYSYLIWVWMWFGPSSTISLIRLYSEHRSLKMGMHSDPINLVSICALVSRK